MRTWLQRPPRTKSRSHAQWSNTWSSFGQHIRTLTTATAFGRTDGRGRAGGRTDEMTYRVDERAGGRTNGRTDGRVGWRVDGQLPMRWAADGLGTARVRPGRLTEPPPPAHAVHVAPARSATGRRLIVSSSSARGGRPGVEKKTRRRKQIQAPIVLTFSFNIDDPVTGCRGVDLYSLCKCLLGSRSMLTWSAASVTCTV